MTSQRMTKTSCKEIILDLTIQACNSSSSLTVGIVTLLILTIQPGIAHLLIQEGVKL